MIYQVKLHYHKYNFADEFEAIKFVKMALTAAEEDGESVEITVIRDEEQEAER